MPKNGELRDLLFELSKENEEGEHGELINAISAAHFYTESLRLPDDYGRIPYVTEENKQKIMELHKAIAEQSEKVLRSRTESREVKEIVQKISALSAASYRQFAAYDPKTEKKTVATIEEDVRMLNLDLRGTPDPEKLGGNMSSRQVLSFKDENGRTVTGLFTPKVQNNSFQAVTDAFNEAAGKAAGDQGKALLENFVEKTRTKLGLSKDENFELLDRIVIQNRKKIGPKGQERRSMKEVDSELLADFIASICSTDEKKYSKEDIINEVGAANLVELTDLLSKHIANVGINMGNGGLPDNSRTDNRNAAMSSVADLLGVPNLIARSRPMKVIDQNGNEIEGTFMAKADGMDINRPASNAGYVDETSLENTDGRGFKAVADLQVLDYICGNVDRHVGNMLYQFDKNWKFIGVQGIDNDCAFGRVVPTHKRRAHLPAPKDMIAVSESMYKKVLALTPAELKYILRGYGLSDVELDAAGQRLSVLQKELKAGKDYYDELDANGIQDDSDVQEDYGDADDSFSFSEDEAQIVKNLPDEKKEKKKLPPFKMRSGKVRIIPDDEFYRMTPAHITAAEKQGNTENHFNSAQYAAENLGKRLGVEEKLEGKVILGADNRIFPSEQSKARDEAGRVVNILDKRTHWYNSSGNYRAMEKAAANYEKFQKQLAERIRLANLPNVKAKKDYRLDLEAIVTPEDLEKMRTLSEKLEKATEAYLNGKLGQGQKLEDYKPYTKNRIEAAKRTLEVAKANKVIKPYEKEAAAINARRAKETMDRRLGTQREAKDIKKGIVKKPVEVLNQK